jgi:hypothetical protein
MEQKVLRNVDPYDAAGDAWLGFNLKALLLFSIYFAGEFIDNRVVLQNVPELSWKNK